jgi:hypothetical protein
LHIAAVRLDFHPVRVPAESGPLNQFIAAAVALANLGYQVGRGAIVLQNPSRSPVRERKEALLNQHEKCRKLLI